MEYLITYGCGFLILLLLIINHKYNKKENIGIKLIAILGALILVTRMFCYSSIIYNESDSFWGLASSSLHNNLLTAFSLIMIWCGYTFILFVLMRPFFKIKFANNIVKYMAVIYFLVNPFFIDPSVKILTYESSYSLLSVMLAIENAFGLGISLYYLLKSIKEKEKVSIKDIGFMFLGFLALSIFTMPTYFLQYSFGFQSITNLWKVKDFSQIHRVFILSGFIIPLIIYYILRDKSYEFKRYSLLYICLGVLIGFVISYDYTDFLKPWNWPFHLCNTALFILPLVLMFKMKRLFYFTYFINVVGAFFAMILPNYSSLNVMDVEIVRFWYNHYIAFFMPIVIVSLDLFIRPKLKQFAYSMAAFLGYFILVLVLNVVFTEMGHNVDYFFINSDFIADKLGKWAENIFRLSLTVNVAGHSYVFHPLYQTLFFLVYVLIGLGVWFIYGEFYRIEDNSVRLRARLKRMKQYDLELEEQLKGRKREEPMEKDAGIKFELSHFSKRYGNSDHYSVKDASFSVHGGEIFGFLGPNGAGKSTIIKSTVGIQPISDGHINICGYDVGTQPVQCKSLIGFVPDHYALYEKLTGREYVNYIADIYGVSEEDRNRRIERYIKLFELEASIDNKIKTYSHGMKQKITIMSALVHDPKVWILDEPLTGLDPNSIYQVKECMKEHAKKGNIVFFSSHIIDIVEKLCERIAIIKHGKIQCVTSVKEIEASGKTLEEFYLETIGNNEIDEEYLQIKKAD